MSLSAQTIAQALRGKPAGEGKWKALCPAHEDHHPSLSISEGRTGVPLVKCWAGCSQEAVIEALRARGLWLVRVEGYRGALPALPTAFERLILRVIEFLGEGPALDTAEQLRELDRLLTDAEYASPDAPYIVVGQILEGATTVSYHCVSRVAAVLGEHGPQAERHVARWINERFPEALLELPA